MKKRLNKNRRSRSDNSPRMEASHSAASYKIPQGRVVIGRNTLREILRHAPQRVLKAYIAESRGDGGARAEFLTLFKQLNIAYQELPFDVLDKLAQSDSHQGVLAVLREREGMGVKDFIVTTQLKERSLLLVLDDIQDPSNLGAILRAAECFGADAVIYSKNRGTSITPAVSKASVGASELVTTLSVSNLADTLKKLKEAGYWIVVADADEGAMHLGEFEFPARSALVMGAEGKGPQKLIKELADFRVFIPLFGRISSLNVSQAAAVLLHRYHL